MATPPKVSANATPLAGAARPVKATKPPRVGAARKGGGRKKDASTGGGGGGFKVDNSPIPD